METLTGRMDVESETGEVIQSFTTVLETGESVSMEIRNKDDVQVSDLLRGALKTLDEKIDRTVLERVLVETEDDYKREAAALLEDKREEKFVVNTLKDFKSLAWTIHRSITGKENEYASYARARAEKRDRALSLFTEEQDRKEAAEQERLRVIARKEEEARKAEEAKILERRAKTERRPDLAAKAEEIRTAPIREFAVSTGRKSVVGSVGGVGRRRVFTVDVFDANALILAVARPAIMREVADMIEKIDGKKKNRNLVAELREEATKLPNIPTAILEVSEARIRASAVGANGKIDWPGVVVTPESKTSTRT
jgi:hypothetical protein